MSWLKKKLNKIFFAIEDEELIESYDDADFEEVHPQKKKFKFPNIADLENEPKIASDFLAEKEHEKVDAPNYMRQDGGISKVYDIEQSGFSKLLEQRKNRKLNRSFTPMKQTTSINGYIKKNAQNVKKQEEEVVKRKKFTPTQVPSPVYGFKKPVKKEKTIVRAGKTFGQIQQELMESKKLKALQENESNQAVELENAMQNEHTIIEESAVDVAIEQNSYLCEELITEAENVSEELVTEVKDEEQALDQTEFEEKQQNVEHNFESVHHQETVEVVQRDEEHVLETFEKDEEQVFDIAEGEAQSEERTEENALENEHTERMEAQENGQAKEIVSDLEDHSSLKEETTKRKTLPFNVIMLKSDKEKLAKKSDYCNVPNGSLSNGTNERENDDTEACEEDEHFDGGDESVPTDAMQLSLPFENVRLNEPIPYELPPLSILAPPEEKIEDREWMEEQAATLVEALSYFQIQAAVESIVQGPAVTQFEITVGHGTKVSKVRNLSDDIQLALAARDIRIDAPIPGKRSIGIEIPNRVSRAVRLSEVTKSVRFQQSDSPLEAALGLDLNGNPVTLDLRKMPHGLIAGATGSGKSVCINSILVSLLYKAAPHELKLMLIDPKMVELAPFNHIPHLVSPVITDVKAATEALKWAVDEMERRYQLFMHSGTRDITRYNKLCEENRMFAQKLPYVLIVIDELAELMMMSPADVELAISRLAQKARACGIHLILATQRPSVDVITGTLKSNIPTRIAFAVSSQIDSRTIIDQQGAERLLGRGDMLYLGNGMNAPMRIQGTFVTDDEIEEVVEYVKSQGEPNYFFKSEELVQKNEMLEEQDELFEEVCRYVFSQGSASTSSIQRKYHIGYNRAARLIDMLESRGLVSEQKGSKPRDVYITEAMLENMFS